MSKAITFALQGAKAALEADEDAGVEGIFDFCEGLGMDRKSCNAVMAGSCDLGSVGVAMRRISAANYLKEQSAAKPKPRATKAKK